MKQLPVEISKFLDISAKMDEIPHPTTLSQIPSSRHEEKYGSCVPRYFRCVISSWRIMYGWLRLINKICLTTSILLTGLATIPELSLDSQTKLGIAAIICQGLALFCEEMYDYAGEAVNERKKILLEIEKEELEGFQATIIDDGKASPV